jgi:hypothetical protein
VEDIENGEEKEEKEEGKQTDDEKEDDSKSLSIDHHISLRLLALLSA